MVSHAVDHFSYNNFHGSLTDDMFMQCGSLRSLFLSHNQLTGEIPKSIGSCLTLQNIDFSSNQLSGNLPDDIWSISWLRVVDFSDNYLDECTANLTIYARGLILISNPKHPRKIMVDWAASFI